MGNLLVRSLSGLVYVALILWACFQNEYSPTILFLVLGILAIHEWQSIKLNNFNPRIFLVSLLAFLGFQFYFSPIFSFHEPYLALIGSVIPLALIFIILNQSFSADEGSISSMIHNLFGLLYIGLPMLFATFLPLVNSESNEPWLLASIFIMIWCSDSFAYLVGRFLGRSKLFERISPNKTWEGFIGGLVFTILASYLLFEFVGILSLGVWIGLAILTSVVGTLGDLFESAIKRHFKIKDSGNIIPGHGGILDRIDSFLFVVPCSYVYLVLVQQF